jgi:hypothetical protein
MKFYLCGYFMSAVMFCQPIHTLAKLSDEDQTLQTGPEPFDQAWEPSPFFDEKAITWMTISTTRKYIQIHI